jgi:probable phosphoglycerate mutase
MIVSHKATIRVLVCALLGIDVGLFRARIGMRVASVTQFSFRKTGPRLDVLGDIAHLPPELHLDVGT